MKLTVKKVPYINEWVARITDNGRLVSSYYSDDKKDAETTGAAELKRELDKKSLA